MVCTKVGDYLLLETIGEGTFGKVKHAIHERTGDKFAVKVMNKDVIKEHSLTLQVRREISVMMTLQHKNVVRLYQVLTSKTRVYIVMDLVTGGELFDKILLHKRLPEDMARSYFLQLIDGLEYCHMRGVYHRDLKPENLLLDDKGVLKITDFGLSSLKTNEPSDILHTQCGTPNYVAPEIIANSGEGYRGSKADLWSCGIILFVLLAGYLPFDDDDPDALFALILDGRLEFPSWFSEQAIDLLCNILQTDSERRYSVQEILTHPWCSFQPSGGEVLFAPDEVLRLDDQLSIDRSEIVTDELTNQTFDGLTSEGRLDFGRSAEEDGGAPEASVAQAATSSAAPAPAPVTPRRRRPTQGPGPGGESMILPCTDDATNRLAASENSSSQGDVPIDQEYCRGQSSDTGEASPWAASLAWREEPPIPSTPIMLLGSATTIPAQAQDEALHGGDHDAVVERAGGVDGRPNGMARSSKLRVVEQTSSAEAAPTSPRMYRNSAWVVGEQALFSEATDRLSVREPEVEGAPRNCDPGPDTVEVNEVFNNSEALLRCSHEGTDRAMASPLAADPQQTSYCPSDDSFVADDSYEVRNLKTEEFARVKEMLTNFHNGSSRVSSSAATPDDNSIVNSQSLSMREAKEVVWRLTGGPNLAALGRNASADVPGGAGLWDERAEERLIRSSSSEMVQAETEDFSGPVRSVTHFLNETEDVVSSSTAISEHLRSAAEQDALLMDRQSSKAAEYTRILETKAPTSRTAPVPLQDIVWLSSFPPKDETLFESTEATVKQQVTSDAVRSLTDIYGILNSISRPWVYTKTIRKENERARGSSKFLSGRPVPQEHDPEEAQEQPFGSEQLYTMASYRRGIGRGTDETFRVSVSSLLGDVSRPTSRQSSGQAESDDSGAWDPVSPKGLSSAAPTANTAPNGVGKIVDFFKGRNPLHVKRYTQFNSLFPPEQSKSLLVRVLSEMGFSVRQKEVDDDAFRVKTEGDFNGVFIAAVAEIYRLDENLISVSIRKARARSRGDQRVFVDFYRAVYQRFCRISEPEDINHKSTLL